MSKYEPVITRYLKTVRLNRYIPHEPTEKQALFLLHDHIPEILYGGSAGGGKSDALLMAALQYVDEPGYAALLLRRTYADLSLPGAIMSRSFEWLSGTDAVWHDKEKTWIFPSGATLSFGYLDGPRDHYRYQGSEFQFCVEKGTKILLADGTHKKIEEINEGDEVQTLEGGRKVIRVYYPRKTQCIKAVTDSGKYQIHPIDHEILTPFGWLSYASICNLFVTSEAKECCGCNKSFSQREQISHSPVQTPLSLSWMKPQSVRALSHQDQRDCEGVCASSKENQNDSEEYYDLLLKYGRHLSLCVPVILHAPDQGSGVSGIYQDQFHYAPSDEQILMEARTNYLCCCFACFHPYDEQLHNQTKTDKYDPPSLNDAEEPSPSYYMRGGLGGIPRHNHMHSIAYIHPYKKELRNSSEGVRYGSCTLTPVGERTVYDITVSDVHHYITFAGLINKNCGFDEVTQFKQDQYLYLHSRLRRLENSNIPIRMRAASNPGDIGHEWVKARFITPESRALNCQFIPASLADNPHLDRVAYIDSLMKLDPITREQLLSGNWDVRPEGGLFKREWMKVTDTVKGIRMPLCRYWDKAATEGGGDWTVGALVGLKDGRVYVIDIKRTQSSPAGVEALILQTAQLDGHDVMIRMEQEPGSAGVDVIDHYARRVLVGYNFKGEKTTGSKVSRAAALSTAAEQGNLFFMNAGWTAACLDELVLFPTEGAHDDQVDAIAGGYNILSLEYCSQDRFKISSGTRRW